MTKKNYTQVPNNVLMDKSLSPETRFLMSFINMLPKETWEFSLDGLATATGMDRKHVAKAMKELISHRYCIRVRVSGGRGKCGWFYVFSNSRFTTVENTTVENTTVENTTVDFFDFRKSDSVIQYNSNIQDLDYTIKKLIQDFFAQSAEKKQESDSSNAKPEPLNVRRQDFRKSVDEYSEKYSKEMLDDFFFYWTETNPSHTKMRFEMQATFELNYRLAYWYRHSKQGKPSSLRQAYEVGVHLDDDKSKWDNL